MQIVNIEEGMVEVQIEPEQAWNLRNDEETLYNLVKDFVLAETGRTIVGQCVNEYYELNLGKPGKAIYRYPF